MFTLLFIRMYFQKIEYQHLIALQQSDFSEASLLVDASSSLVTSNVEAPEDLYRQIQGSSTPRVEPQVPHAVVEEYIVIKGVEFNLKSFLESQAVGRAILIIYQYTKELSTACQSYLVDMITVFFLNKDM